MRRVLAAAVLALLLPGVAEAARFAVGVTPGADVRALSALLEQRTGGRVEPLAPFAVALEAESARGLGKLPGVAYVERVDRGGRRLAFAPTDPFFVRQWYLGASSAFDAWPQRPQLPGIRIAVIDSGIDAGHPELAGRIAEAKSFVGGSVRRDIHGHGTFVAGMIAATMNNDEGIAGMAFPAQLLVAKVVRPDGVVPLEAEARAIRWAADRGARVINLSLGGVRHPADASRDSFSALEASAVAYAVRKGAVVVASVGNGDQAPEQPWRYASYPAALPHVLGVSAFSRDGSVPMFSNRDPIYNDIAAPGDELFSTLPRALTALRPACAEQGYSECGPTEYRNARGTSFAAAVATAGAALVRTARPGLRAEQVVALIERTATDMTPATGCRRCTAERDATSGWGRLNVAAAVNFDGRLPAIDSREPNDDVGARAERIRSRGAGFDASLDFWDDQHDVYAIPLRRRGRVVATLTPHSSSSANVDVMLWKPGTRRLAGVSERDMLRRSARPEGREVVRYLGAPRAGVYFLQVKIMEPGTASYTLRIVRR